MQVETAFLHCLSSFHESAFRSLYFFLEVCFERAFPGPPDEGVPISLPLTPSNLTSRHQLNFPNFDRDLRHPPLVYNNLAHATSTSSFLTRLPFFTVGDNLHPTSPTIFPHPPLPLFPSSQNALTQQQGLDKASSPFHDAPKWLYHDHNAVDRGHAQGARPRFHPGYVELPCVWHHQDYDRSSEWNDHGRRKHLPPFPLLADLALRPLKWHD